MNHGLWKLPRLTALWKACRFAWKSAQALFHSPPTGPWKSLRRHVASTIPTAAWKTRTCAKRVLGATQPSSLRVSISPLLQSAFPTAPTGPTLTGLKDGSKTINRPAECYLCSRFKVLPFFPVAQDVAR